MNQCDGCRAGKPLDENGNHRMGEEGKYPDLMGCQAYRYTDHGSLLSDPQIQQIRRAGRDNKAGRTLEVWLADFGNLVHRLRRLDTQEKER